MTTNIQNQDVEFLRAIRTGWCNTDYIEFLVEKVWRIKEPVRVLDFGCGLGYVGHLLMPILPEGSNYTGIDRNEDFLEVARESFIGVKYQVEFIHADLNEYVPEVCYDLAISQAVLRHIPQGKKVLEKMAQSVMPGGLVVCFENDLEADKAGQYFSGFDYTDLGMTELFRKKYKKEFADGGRDYRFGVKAPIYMQELGLRNVGVRMNDSMKFVNPLGPTEEYELQYEAMSKAWGWDSETSSDERANIVRRLVREGLTMPEADQFMDNEARIGEFVREHQDSNYIIQPTGTIISFGWK